MYKRYFYKFIFRTIVFIYVSVLYFTDKSILDFTSFNGDSLLSPIGVLGIVLLVTMLIHIVPHKSMCVGIGKQFKDRFKESKREVGADEINRYMKARNKGAYIFAAVWIVFHIGVGFLYNFEVIGIAELVMLTFLYYFGDYICILFVCPFQLIFTRNRCCSVCRIFAWDSVMMVTPLFIVPSIWSYILAAVGLVTLVLWEVKYYKHPEYFYEETNDAIKCANCTDKLCKVRKPLYENKTWIDM